jgi:hypothetical protein
MNYEKCQISVYTDVFSTKPVKEVPITDFYDLIRSDKLKGKIEKLRTLETKNERDEIKKTLPAVTCSGTFEERKTSKLIQHSGRICIDIDGTDNPDIDMVDLRDTIGNWDDIEFCALSASGKGLFCVLKIQQPDLHLKHFRSLQRAFHTIGIKIDPACSDVSRLRIVSYDPDAVYNPDAEVYEKIYIEPIKYHLPQPTRDQLDRMIKKVIDAHVDITGNYDQWVEVGRSLVGEYGEGGRSYFHALSRISDKYKSAEDCDKTYNACIKNPGNYSGSTIFYYAKDQGVYLKE